MTEQLQNFFPLLPFVGRAGLIVTCSETSDVLVLTGDAGVGLDEDGHVQSAEIGAERLWRIRPRQGHWLRGALLLALQLKRWSPDTLATGDWRQRVEVGHSHIAG